MRNEDQLAKKGDHNNVPPIPPEALAVCSASNMFVGESYADDEREFLMAMDRYKTVRQRKFPTWIEALAVLKSLGYSKKATPAPQRGKCMSAKEAKQLAAYHDLSVEDLSFALKYLVYYGLLDAQNITAQGVADAAEKFQTEADIDVDGLLGHQTLEAMWAPRCGVKDNAFTQAAKWRKKKLKLYVDQYLEGVPGLSVQDQRDLQDLGLQHYMQVIDVEWSRASSKSEADLILSAGQGTADQFDGPGGTLAWCQIPPGDDRAIIMKFDKSDTWIKSADSGRRGILYQNVWEHELGHGHGMFHITDGRRALLNPIYASAVSTLLQPDKDELWRLGYAKPTAVPPVPPTNPPVPVDPKKRTIITLVITGDVVDAAVPGYKKV